MKEQAFHTRYLGYNVLDKWSSRFFKDVLCSTIVKTYYAHPLAWNEIGYNGPSSPRGHVRKWASGVDPWEAHTAGMKDEG